MSRYRVVVCRECPERHAIMSGGTFPVATWAASVSSALAAIAEAEARRLAGGDWRLTESPRGVVVAKRVVLPHMPEAARARAEAGVEQPFRSWGQVARFMAAWRVQETARLARLEVAS